MDTSAELDHRYLWHPFTQMRDWLKREPIVIAAGEGAVLRDVKGRKYLDANSSIWTNLHGHSHPKINAAIQRQLKRIAHSSALGLANEPAAKLAAELVRVANPNFRNQKGRKGEREKGSSSRFASSPFPPFALSKVFLSDDGSTAMEVALKLAYEFARRTGRSRQPKFLSLAGGYHGDTLGAVALGHIDLFHKTYEGLLFKTDKVAAPYCYRCPHNRAKPERTDARESRRCNWECLDNLERKFEQQKKKKNPYAAFVVEPLIQGAAGMIPQPPGWLRRANEIIRGHGSQLIADEVLTGFGRTGLGIEGTAKVEQRKTTKQPAATTPPSPLSPLLPFSPPLFACHHEGVQPDFMALAKGLTGGYLPMAATLTTQAVFDAFLGEYDDFKTFFHGHSYTGNQLGAAAALASLALLQSPGSIRNRQHLERTLRDEVKSLWSLANVGDIRQVGLIVGIELVRNWRTREPFDLRERAGIRVCEALDTRGVLTRAIGNVIVLMPPYCTTPEQTSRMVKAIGDSIAATFATQ
jgi:adenosylmethionine-8-amino-7-oxononanoate aminotransferase